ncbi:TRAP transporter large permease [Reinekea blandensis]|uniref:TRAP transporter large permease protein n=1 Tax=Reinekea blandensis MED297 TaxID=314283 RepID=A4BCK5_9GAMM|nr:TRAP transporter large permease subunit [Reinekea blandensis]EAR10271.1 C4-dicarboxylate permease (large subunit), probably cold-shock inducible [Reinekea sp. MED297] [Reinekea blandensis MED297]
MNSLMIALIVIAAVLGAPLFVIILSSAGAGFWSSGIDLMVLPIELYRLTENTLLIALPLFTFAGYLLSESRTADRLVNLSQAAFGWLPGGMVLIVLLASAFFTMLTGGSGVTIVALGALLLPALKQAGYQDRFSLGLVTTSGSLGLLLPPAIPLILYGIVAQQMDVANVDIQDLFIAGFIPALLMILSLWLYALWVHRHQKLPLTSFEMSKVLQHLNVSKWELAIPLIVLGGILGGWLVISDIAAITALYVLIIEVFVYREVRIKDLPRIAAESMKMVGGILLILGVALAFTNFLVDMQVPAKVFELVQANIDSRWAFLLCLNIGLLLLGAILDIFAALIIIVPLILPIAMEYGIDPVHLGIIFVANMQIGYFTPPVGMNLFIASYRFKRSIAELYRATWPMMIVLLAVVLLITYWPAMVLVFVD